MSIDLSLAAPIATGLVGAIGVLWNEYKNEKKQTKQLQEEVKKEKQEKLDQYKDVSKELTELCKDIVEREDNKTTLIDELEKQIHTLKQILQK